MTVWSLTALDDMWAFDTKQQVFEQVAGVGGPEGRSFFGFAAVQRGSAAGTLVLFGG